MFFLLNIQKYLICLNRGKFLNNLTTTNPIPTKIKLTNIKFNRIEDFMLESKFLGIDKKVCDIPTVRISAIASLVPIFESFI